MGEYRDGVNEELFARAKNGDPDAESLIVESNMALVGSIIKRFLNREQEYDDLFQIGCIGLIKAVHKFDSSYNVKFSTYAVPLIIGEIKRFLRDDGMLKVSRSVKELSYKVSRARDELGNEYGRDPTISEIAAHIGAAEDDVVNACEASYRHESLYETVSDGDSSPVLLIDRLGSTGEDEPGILIDRLAMRQLISRLNAEERRIIVLRYFRQKTQAQVAEQLGVSQVQISRIEKKILSEMRRKISE